MIDEKRFSQYRKTFKELFNQINTGNNKFRPQKVGKNIKLLVGVDGGKYAVSIVTSKIDIDTTSTALINVRQLKINEDEDALIFRLMDNDLISIFISFCIDIESVLNEDENTTVVEIYNRYLYWQKMFKIENTLISESTIKGLISELYILENYMIPKYGTVDAIKGWMGTENSNKDFTCKDDMWYEVKGINVGKVTVKISSVEQLESDYTGMLMIAELERASETYSKGDRVIDLLNRIKKEIELEDIQMLFYDKVVSLGISLDIFSDPNHKANLYRYLIKNISCYKVDSDFPKLERKDLTNAVGKVSYDLILSELNDFHTEFY